MLIKVPTRIEVWWYLHSEKRYEPYQTQIVYDPFKFIGYYPDQNNKDHLVILAGMVREGGMKKEHSTLLALTLENPSPETISSTYRQRLAVAGMVVYGLVTDWDSIGLRFKTPTELQPAIIKALGFE